MAEILPDVSFQNYFRNCPVCGKTVETNIQGDELGKHTCGKVGTNPSYEWNKMSGRLIEDPSTADWEDIVKKKPKEEVAKPIYWKLEDIKDYLGNQIQIGDRAIRVHSYDHYKQFKKVTIEKIDIHRKYDPVGVITDGNTKIGWTYPERVITQESFKPII